MTNIKAIRSAASRLKGYVRETPILTSPFLDEIAGKNIYVKAESLQHTGSFKFRGGWSAISEMSEKNEKMAFWLFPLEIMLKESRMQRELSIPNLLSSCQKTLHPSK